jgi:hypothetical protein
MIGRKTMTENKVWISTRFCQPGERDSYPTLITNRTSVSKLTNWQILASESSLARWISRISECPRRSRRMHLQRISPIHAQLSHSGHESIFGNRGTALICRGDHHGAYSQTGFTLVDTFVPREAMEVIFKKNPILMGSFRLNFVKYA